VESNAPLRVAVFGTGGIGSIAVPSIAHRSDLDLVGVRVHSPAKVGQDAGVLSGGAPLGITATDDLDALLALGLDCACYTSSDGGVNASAIDDYVRLLESGVNVVTVSTPGMVHPPSVDPRWRDRLARAAEQGGATIYASGIEPGFAADQLVATLLTMSRRITSVRAQEIFMYDTYPVEFAMFDVFGFGRPLDETPIMALPGVQAGTWGPVVRYVAAALGVTLDEVRETYEREPTPRTLEVACGTIEAGTAGAVRFETIGVVDGRDVIVIEHVNRMAADLAPHWPTAERDGTYRIVVDGEPAMRCDLVIGSGPHDASAHGMVATTMRIVNAIPAVCAAAPGLVSSLDLPLTMPRNAL
jgi:hypothetical protein